MSPATATTTRAEPTPAWATDDGLRAPRRLPTRRPPPTTLTTTIPPPQSRAPWPDPRRTGQRVGQRPRARSPHPTAPPPPATSPGVPPAAPPRPRPAGAAATSPRATQDEGHQTMPPLANTDKAKPTDLAEKGSTSTRSSTATASWRRPLRPTPGTECCQRHQTHRRRPQHTRLSPAQRDERPTPPSPTTRTNDPAPRTTSRRTAGTPGQRQIRTGTRGQMRQTGGLEALLQLVGHGGGVAERECRHALEARPDVQPRRTTRRGPLHQQQRRTRGCAYWAPCRIPSTSATSDPRSTVSRRPETRTMLPTSAPPESAGGSPPMISGTGDRTEPPARGRDLLEPHAHGS